MAFCGALVLRGALQLAAAVLFLLAVTDTADGGRRAVRVARLPAMLEGARPLPRAARIGNQFVLVIPREPIDPGDRRPR